MPKIKGFKAAHAAAQDFMAKKKAPKKAAKKGKK